MEKYRAPLAVSESLSTIHEHPIDNRNIDGQILSRERVTPSTLKQFNQVAKEAEYEIQLSNKKSNEIENLNEEVNSKIQCQLVELTKSSDKTSNRYLNRTNSKTRK